MTINFNYEAENGNDYKKTRDAVNDKMDAIKLGVIYLGRNFGKVWSLDTFDTHTHTHIHVYTAAFNE